MQYLWWGIFYYDFNVYFECWMTRSKWTSFCSTIRVIFTSGLCLICMIFLNLVCGEESVLTNEMQMINVSSQRRWCHKLVVLLWTELLSDNYTLFVTLYVTWSILLEAFQDLCTSFLFVLPSPFFCFLWFSLMLVSSVNISFHLIFNISLFQFCCCK